MLVGFLEASIASSRNQFIKRLRFYLQNLHTKLLSKTTNISKYIYKFSYQTTWNSCIVTHQILFKYSLHLFLQQYVILQKGVDDDDDGNDGWFPHADIQRLMAHLAIAQFTKGRSLARSSSSLCTQSPVITSISKSMLTKVERKKLKRDINEKESQMEDVWKRSSSSLCNGILSRASAYPSACFNVFVAYVLIV